MPHLLTPYENTANASRLNAAGQITRRQFEMLIEPETPITRAQVRRLRLLMVMLVTCFALWGGLYWGWRDARLIAFDVVVMSGAALLFVCVLVVLSGMLRILAITPTTEEIGEQIRKRIREGTLGIECVEGRIRFRHLVSGTSMLCSVIVARREFPVSQALWEGLQEVPGGNRWTVYYLRDPASPLSIVPSYELSLPPSGAHEAVVSGHTIARRGDA